MLKTVRYAATPHSMARNHKIPIEVIEYLTGQTNETALDKKRCLFEIWIISHTAKPVALPPVILEPRSGGEVFVGKRVCDHYPDSFGAGEYLLVQLTPL
jgi:hypothetical protein